MNTEESQVEETTNSTQEETNDEAQVHENEQVSNESEDVSFYKAELEKAKNKLVKAEYTLKKRNIDSKKGDDSEDSGADMEKLKEEIIRDLRKADRDVLIAQKLDEMTTDNDERELIRFHYENTIQQSGDERENVLDDLKIAKAIVSASKLNSENSELMEALNARQSLGNTSAGTNQDRPKPKQDLYAGFSQADKEYMQARGFTEEQVKRARENL